MSTQAAIVTGAASGIGRALTDQLRSSGAEVLAVDTNAEGLADAAAATGCATRVADIRTAAENEAIVADALDRFGRLDRVFLNAGVLDRDLSVPTYEPADIDLDRYVLTRGVNLDGVVYGTVAAARAMAERGGGSIVATASVAGLVGYGPAPLYAATKAGVVAMVTSFGSAFDAVGVRINAICPGGVATPMVGIDPGVAAAMPTMLAPADLAAEMIATADDGEPGAVYSVVAGRDPIRQRHVMAEVPGFP